MNANYGKKMLKIPGKVIKIGTACSCDRLKFGSQKFGARMNFECTHSAKCSNLQNSECQIEYLCTPSFDICALVNMIEFIQFPPSDIIASWHLPVNDAGCILKSCDANLLFGP